MSEIKPEQDCDDLISPRDAMQALADALGIELSVVYQGMTVLEQPPREFVLVPMDWLNG